MKLSIYPRVQAFREHLLTIRSRKTAYAYSYYADLFEKFLADERLTLETVHAGVLQDLVTQLVARKVATVSIILRITATRVYIRWVLGTDAKFTPPKFPRVNQKSKLGISTRDLTRFMEHARNASEPYATIMQLLPACGLRISEMVRLKVDDLRIDKGSTGERHVWIRVRASVEGEPDWQTKSRQDRNVPLIQDANLVLFSYLRNTRPTGYIFPPPRGPGPHAGIRTVEKIVHSIAQQLNIEELTPHTFRHYYITRLVQQKVDMFAIRQIVGHRDIDTTQRYVHHDTVHLQNSVAGIRAPWLQTKG